MESAFHKNKELEKQYKQVKTMMEQDSDKENVKTNLNHAKEKLLILQQNQDEEPKNSSYSKFRKEINTSNKTKTESDGSGINVMTNQSDYGGSSTYNEQFSDWDKMHEISAPPKVKSQ